MRDRSNEMTPNVVGAAELAAKKSAVDEKGQLARVSIEGVKFRPTRPVPHEDGHVTEVARASWEILETAGERSAFCGVGPGENSGVRWPERFSQLWPDQRIYCQRQEPGTSGDSSKSLSRLEKYRHDRSDDHQHA